MAENLTVEDGKIAIPAAVRSRYGIIDHTPIRMIETRTGILLVPLTNEPMSKELVSELEDWQELGSQSLVMFPYEESDE
jgi:bifunctional DNA-binding transcriptional regulator/antitoxin component of YhaV-PrlF toxin-antitoxin module